jgi:catechol 2,3-dioxygenase-like lactoylglutathione lyase family enzyme
MTKGHLGLFSRNASNLIRFYTEKLGFQEGESRTVSRSLMEDIFGLAEESRMTKLSRDDLTLEIFSLSDVAPASEADCHIGFNHFGLWVEDKEAFCRTIKDQGATVIKSAYRDRFIFFVRDPDGNRIEIFER